MGALVTTEVLAAPSKMNTLAVIALPDVLVTVSPTITTVVLAATV
jgi:hypothetical protein